MVVLFTKGCLDLCPEVSQIFLFCALILAIILTKGCLDLCLEVDNNVLMTRSPRFLCWLTCNYLSCFLYLFISKFLIKLVEINVWAQDTDCMSWYYLLNPWLLHKFLCRPHLRWLCFVNPNVYQCTSIPTCYSMKNSLIKMPMTGSDALSTWRTHDTPDNQWFSRVLRVPLKQSTFLGPSLRLFYLPIISIK